MTDPVAAADQASATVSQVARVVASYYKGLCTNGVPAELAGILTMAYQAAVLSGSA